MVWPHTAPLPAKEKTANQARVVGLSSELKIYYMEHRHNQVGGLRINKDLSLLKLYTVPVAICVAEISRSFIDFCSKSNTDKWILYTPDGIPKRLTADFI